MTANMTTRKGGTMNPILEELLDHHVAGESQQGWTETGDYTPDDLIALHNAARDLARAAADVARDVLHSLTLVIPEGTHQDADGGEWKIGWRRKRSCLNPAALQEWLGDDWPKALNVSAAKVTGLKAIARKRQLDPDTVEDTFFTHTWQPSGIRYTPPETLTAG